MAKIVLSAWVNGMGDNLAISTLPERYVRERGDEVWIHNNFRNFGARDMVWGHNKWIAGFTDEPPNVITPNDDQMYEGTVQYGSLITAIEAGMGFAYPYHKWPKVYYTPPFNRELQDKVLLDPASVTCKISEEVFTDYVDFLVKNRHFRMDQCVFLDPGVVDHTQNYLPNVPRFKPINSYDTMSAIYSCKRFVTVHSGLGAIASALKGDNPYPKVDALIVQAVYNLKRWGSYKNLNYYTTGRIKQDFEFV